MTMLLTVNVTRKIEKNLESPDRQKAYLAMYPQATMRLNVFIWLVDC